MISDNIKQLKQDVDDICRRLHRDPREIKIVAVTKTVPVLKIEEAINCGVEIIGENRIQETEEKYRQISSPAQWHFIGHLQKNKVKKAVKIFDLIQSVDSLVLVEEINRQAQLINKVQEILIEIKISPEPTKYGVAPQDLKSFLAVVGNGRDRSLQNIKIKGLMTIGPLLNNLEQTRPYFRRMKDLYEEAKLQNIPGIKMEILSMGMSDDYQIALEEGSNMIRIGRMIFGERSKI
ncbi:MAG: YggS family pyridoxal phosphate-dependent enzyme [Elusimicrobiota bacterium]